MRRATIFSFMQAVSSETRAAAETSITESLLLVINYPPTKHNKQEMEATSKLRTVGVLAGVRKDISGLNWIWTTKKVPAG
mmetsp:Transcript_21517/g.34977  ORF Transcript_21517/g.34977 Transcript_21517/m.34977 type:complete len:80 (+) Transcript_21517:333-572(+)